MSEQLELLPEEAKKEPTRPKNYDENLPYTLYNYGNNQLSLSNSWSRKSIRLTFSGNEGSLLWVLEKKCDKYTILDEFGTVYSNDKPLDKDTIEDVPMDIIAWINQCIILHIDFLVGISQTRIKET